MQMIARSSVQLTYVTYANKWITLPFWLSYHVLVRNKYWNKISVEIFYQQWITDIVAQQHSLILKYEWSVNVQDEMMVYINYVQCIQWCIKYPKAILK